jgi:purine-binding chemotaxis protein CheW
MKTSSAPANGSCTALNVAYKGYKDGSVEFFGDNVQAMTGYSKEAFNSKQMKWTDIALEEDKASMLEAFKNALKSDKTYMREYRIKAKGQTLIWMQEWAQIVCDDQGEIEYVLGILLDITEQKQIEEERMKAEALSGKYLVLNLDSTAYGIEISKVKEIIGITEITAVPQTPAFVKGVINLRGKVIPIVDLRVKFDITATAYHDRTCIIVVEFNGGAESVPIGLVVDEVTEVAQVNGEDVEDNPAHGTGLTSDYIIGMAKSEGTINVLLDIDKVLNTEEQALLKEVA